MHAKGASRPTEGHQVALGLRRAVELAPEYVDVAVKRFQQNFPDAPVTLASTGQSFGEVAAMRDVEAVQ